MKKKVIILGATGSIGNSTIECIRSQKDIFQIVGLTSHSSATALRLLADEFDVKQTVLSCCSDDENHFAYYGSSGILQMLQDTEADIVVNGITGASGLMPSVYALETDKDLALANKETAVIAGNLISDLAVKNNRTILPVDSEHAAIFQLTRFRPTSYIKKIILTSSGGPFRNADYKTLLRATPEQALQHPTWSMGSKISIDSATLANKGLEVIETVSLFDTSWEHIDVLIHPQSYVHSLIKTHDGSLYAQISEPDMKVPIINALLYPDITKKTFTELDLVDKTLTFSNPDMGRFPMLQYSYQVLKSGGAYAIAYNASNEIAVEHFLHRGIGFMDIPRVVNNILQLDWSQRPGSFEEVLLIDREVRRESAEIIKKRWY
ncbi:MAG: 1-deoxy-D-xylulose-5-phosphate reductoisomerase [Spirochaetota bacterium]